MLSCESPSTAGTCQQTTNSVVKECKTKRPTNIKFSRGEKSFTIKFKKKENINQIRYSLNKNMKNAKYKRTKKSSCTFKGLKYKRYYVQVRGVKKEHFSSWTNKSAVRPKKPKKKKKYKHSATFVISHYCPGRCCNGSCTRTRMGTRITPGRTIAVDPNIIPLGKTVYINGHAYKAEDTGGAIKGYRIDLCVSSHAEAMRRGKIRRVVRW